MPLVPELESLRNQAEVATAAAVALCQNLEREQMTTRPRATSWSLTEVLVHLRMTVDQCLPALDRAIATARQRGLLSDGPFRLGPMGRFFVWYVEPPPLIRLPAPRSLRPLPGVDPVEALGSFREGQQFVLARMDRANGVDLVRARFTSPFAGFVTMDLLAVFSVFAAHTRRHVFQMEKIRQYLAAAA